MLPRFPHWLAVGLVAFAVTLPAQDTTPRLQSKVVGAMPAAEIDAIRESRRIAWDELLEDRSRYDPPQIASALEFPTTLIAVAKITAVEPQDKDKAVAASRWSPPQEGKFLVWSASRPTALDLAEPKAENLYLIGYRLPVSDESNAYIDGAIDFSVPGQGQTFAEIQHYLAIDASAGDSNFAPFLAALNDPVPWIRDLARHRLANSDACRASAACGEAVMSRVRELLRSKEARERREAVDWLQRLMSGHLDDQTQSAFDNGTLHALLNSAISDPNPVIGDQAFSFLTQWDASLSAGQCLETIPELRKTVVWDFAEVKDRSVSSPFGSSMSCTAPSPPAAQ